MSAPPMEAAAAVDAKNAPTAALENHRTVFHKLPQGRLLREEEGGHFYRGKDGDISNES